VSPAVAARSAAEAAKAEQTYLALVRDYQSAILNYIWRRVGDPDLAEDLTQETFVKAWRALDRLELDDGAEARRRAWLYTIAHNAIADHARRQRRIRWLSLDALPNVSGGGNPAPDVARRDPLQQALARLTADQREVLLLFSHEGLPAEDVAQILGITPAAARKRRQRAREAFAVAWTAIGETLPNDADDPVGDAEVALRPPLDARP
jgi:RNA polymerase sigma-70 factor (ECF subfamily)